MNPTDAEALVGFVGTSDIWWLRLLRPGFRHCFVAVRQGDVWLILDPLSHHTALHCQTHDDLAGFYAAHGITAVSTRLRQPPHRPAPWRPYTCVEAVKRVLGIHAPRIWTPWQLYRHLTS